MTHRHGEAFALGKVDADLLGHCKALRRKGLVHLKQINVLCGVIAGGACMRRAFSDRPALGSSDLMAGAGPMPMICCT